TSSTAAVPGLIWLSAAFWSQAPASQLAASAAGNVPPMTKPKYRGPAIAVVAGPTTSSSRARTSWSAIGLSGNGTSSSASRARALRAWLAGLPVDQRPEVVLSSPYRRAVQTAELTIGDLDLPVRLDERLRDRELGLIDLLTRYGVKRRYPEEAVRRARLGPFYYRPPGGEAWTDVALRLRAVLGDLRRDHPDRTVLL